MNADGSTVYTGDYSGRVVAWDLASGEGTELTGKGHTNQVCVFGGKEVALVSCMSYLKYVHVCVSADLSGYIFMYIMPVRANKEERVRTGPG